jgi:hypothetical protein
MGNLVRPQLRGGTIVRERLRVMKADTNPQRELEGTNKAVRSTAEAAGKGQVLAERSH